MAQPSLITMDVMLKKLLALLLGVAALLVLAHSVLFVANEHQYTLIYQSGQLQHVVQEPGVQLKWPWPVQEVRVLNRRVLTSTGDTGQTPIVLADDKKVPTVWYVRWRIIQPQHYAQQIGRTSDAGSKVLNLATTSVLQTLWKHVTWPQLLQEPHEAVQKELKKRLNNMAQSADKPWGLEVLDVRLIRVDMDQAATQVVQMQMSQTLAQYVEQLKAQTASEAAAARTEVDSKRDALLAEGQLQAQKIRAQGDAQAIRLYEQDYARNPQFARFYYALATYRNSFGQGTDVLVIDYANNTLFQNLQNNAIPTRTAQAVQAPASSSK